ncbi:MAG: membrane dipeptidase [Anaerolineae bacterium]|nr:membrane dipeptidase [Anaerolineae bacterium]
MKIFDGHNDTLTHFYELQPGKEHSFFEASDRGHLDLPRARKGQFAGGLFAIFTHPEPGSPERDPMYGLTFTDEGYDLSPRSALDQGYADTYTHEVIDFACQLEAESKGALKIATTVAELEQGFADDVLAMVLAIEGAEAIYADLSNLEDYYQRGVRSIGLVWSRPNAFGEGVPFRFPHSPDTGAGLTNQGKALVRACNELGIMIDLAHLNEAGFRDVAALSTAPLVVTHADVYAICPSTRNLTDAQIDAVAASGGIIGINFEPLNTHPHASIDQSVPLTQITQHLDYIVQRVGVDYVAFGSDFDGADMPDVLKDVTGLPRLIEQLQAQGYDEAALEKIAYKNWLRVFKTTWQG